MNYRAYHFGNFYMSQIQQGIQAAHAQTELFKKYCKYNLDDSKDAQIVWTWAESPTMICLNGGNNQGLNDLYEFFSSSKLFPFAKFNEDEQSLGSITTNVVVILPERIWNARQYDLVLTDGEVLRKKNRWEDNPSPYGRYTCQEIEIVNKISQYRLA